MKEQDVDMQFVLSGNGMLVDNQIDITRPSPEEGLKVCR